MGIKYGTIDKVLPEISTDMINNIGKHNDFRLILKTNNNFPGKDDPIIVRFDAIENEWRFVADRTIINFGHAIETIEIIRDYVSLEKKPLDEVLWDVFILENDNVVKILDGSTLELRNNVITGLDGYIGKTIQVMYAFGDQEVVQATIEERPTVVRKSHYLNEIVDARRNGTYVPSNMNDIEDEFYYEGEIFNDSCIAVIPEDITLPELKQEFEFLVEIVNSIRRRTLVTTSRILIENNRVTLPSTPYGDLVHNLAIIYETNDLNNNTIFEVTCSLDGDSVLFDSNDNLNGKFCSVSYLTTLAIT